MDHHSDSLFESAEAVSWKRNDAGRVPVIRNAGNLKRCADPHTAPATRAYPLSVPSIAWNVIARQVTSTMARYAVEQRMRDALLSPTTTSTDPRSPVLNS